MSMTSTFSQISTLPFIPELFDPSFIEVLLPAPNDRTVARPGESSVTVMADGALPNKSAGSATLDAFHIRSRNSPSRLDEILHDSWSEDPELTLRIIWNIRSIHDGKGKKELFYRAFGWLYEHHPRTAIFNLPMLIAPVCETSKGNLASHGYWKDLLNILALATCDELSDFHSRPSNFLRSYTAKNTKQDAQLSIDGQAREQKIENQHFRHHRLVEKLAVPKYRALHISVARLFAERLRKDVQTLSQLQSLDPNSEKEQYLAHCQSISLAGKWAPTPGGSHDQVTNISTAICQLLFSPNENAGPGAIGPLPSTAPHPISTEAGNCATYRSYYQRWILKPLREILACPEPLMSAKRWNEIQYSRVPSICMARNREHFTRHDPEGFQLHLAEVKSKKKRASCPTLLPHELIAEADKFQKARVAAQEEEYHKVAEFKQRFAEEQLGLVDARWKSSIARLKDSGSFVNSIAVCGLSDLTGSLPEYDKNNVNPAFPSIALSLVLASLSKPPFNAGFITLSENPTFVRLEGLEEDGLMDLVNGVLSVKSGGNTDLQAVFLRVLLPLARQHSVAKEDMIKRVFVFSDMQFDHVAGTVTGPWWLNRTSESERAERWEESYGLIEKAFREAGYDVPEIVFWDLAGETMVREAMEAETERKGVAMMTGFSNEMMKAFLGEETEEEGSWMEVTKDGDVFEIEEVEDEESAPLDVMKQTLLKKSYDGLVLMD